MWCKSNLDQSVECLGDLPISLTITAGRGGKVERGTAGFNSSVLHGTVSLRGHQAGGGVREDNEEMNFPFSQSHAPIPASLPTLNVCIQTILILLPSVLTTNIKTLRVLGAFTSV